ncbi:MAG: YihY/virulence factor BrkB family protein [Corynebacterium glucuronolyticum]|nr:YihY/virulence factor BrkB family protein [Corynebacterium glucuronolyticum]
MRAFARSSNFIYGRVEGRTVVPTWLTMWGITVLMVIGAAVIVGALLLRQSVVLAVFEPIAEPLGLVEEIDFLTRIFLPIWARIRLPVIALIALTLVAVLYYFAPSVRPQHFRWLTLGSAVSVVTIGITWWLLGLYLQYFAGSSAYVVIGAIIAVIFACWILNILLLVGIKLDAEVLRAKELQMGYDSERMIQAPPLGKHRRAEVCGGADEAGENCARH